MRLSFFQHLHPPTIPAPQSRWRYTLGAGGLAFYWILVIMMSGAFEMLYYIATPGEAALSIQTLTFLVRFGNLIRNLHYWTAQALMVTVLIHLLRVIYTGAYAPPRRFNYLLGLSQLVLIGALNWSGYVLRWDQGVGWALVVGTNMLKAVPFAGKWLYRLVTGGNSLNPATLTRFYAAHIFTLMLLLLGLTVWHIFRVRRDGGIAVPPAGQRTNDARITRFELVRREIPAAILATAGILLLAAFVPAPLAPPLKSLSLGVGETLDPYAPWFVLWIQGLVRLGNPFWMGIVIPGAIFGVMALLPFIFPVPPPEERGRWFPRGGRLAQLTVSALALLIIGLTIWTRLQ